MLGPLRIRVTERYQYHGGQFEVVDVDADRVQLRSTTHSRTIVFQTMEKLHRAWQKGQLRRLQEAPFADATASINASLSPRHQATVSKRLAYLLPVLEKFGGHLPKTEVKLLLRDIAATRNDTKPPSYGSLYLWRKAYLAGGELSLALVPKARHSTLHRLNHQPEEVQQLIRLNVEQLYYTRTPCSKTEVIQAIQCAIEASNRARGPAHQLPIPSTTTLYRIICELDRFETDSHQLGFRVAAKRQKWSKKCQRPSRRFDLVEADTHEMDVETCDEYGEPLGRPYLTVLIEIRTRIIVGWDLSYNPPSLEKTIRALKQSLMTENLYGGTALRYRVDNGSEFIATLLKQILSDLGSDVTYCEPGNPDQKPHIESFFKSWTLSIAHCMRGTTFSTHTGYDSEDNATYTLDVVKKRFEEWVANFYHENYHTGLQMSPKEAWLSDEESRREFGLRKFSATDLNRYFLSVAYVTPNNGRLRFRGLAWTGPAVSYLATRRPGKKRQLRLLYDVSELGSAWVCDPAQPDQIYSIMAVEPAYQKGMTMHVHDLIKAQLKINMRKFNYNDAIAARVRILHEISETNSKRRRKSRVIAKKNMKPVESSSSATAPPSTLHRDESGPSAQYHLHPDTPSSYHVVEVNNGPGKTHSRP